MRDICSTHEAVKRAKPILKWAGGKRQIISDLVSSVPENFNTYYEPFFGGGALFIELSNRGLLKRSVISDINGDLMDLYRMVRDRPDDLVNALSSLRFRNSKDDYYVAREQYNSMKRESCPEKYALLIYLNRHGYNGLYRVNSRGDFNVPFGSYENPSLPGTNDIYALSDALKKAQILNADYREAVKTASRHDFVYFDPPYMPINGSSNFTSYSPSGFREDDQRDLFHTFLDLSEREVFVMESNSGTPFIEDMYSGFNMFRVKARRNINSVANLRGPIDEIIIRNYD
ncbi:DNA adenine methylase [Thermoplasma sp.]|uniref:DNA adenine methylase n=1 Tax=Thermoplasma sp. TaxID=1973142 RepID=UPI00260C3CD2|nr:DNA adenine methylase [Thermoplasma sp.]